MRDDDPPRLARDYWPFALAPRASGERVVAARACRSRGGGRRGSVARSSTKGARVRREAARSGARALVGTRESGTASSMWVDLVRAAVRHVGAPAGRPLRGSRRTGSAPPTVKRDEAARTPRRELPRRVRSGDGERRGALRGYARCAMFGPTLERARAETVPRRAGGGAVRRPRGAAPGRGWRRRCASCRPGTRPCSCTRAARRCCGALRPAGVRHEEAALGWHVPRRRLGAARGAPSTGESSSSRSRRLDGRRSRWSTTRPGASPRSTPENDCAPPLAISSATAAAAPAATARR